MKSTVDQAVVHKFKFCQLTTTMNNAILDTSSCKCWAVHHRNERRRSGNMGGRTLESKKNEIHASPPKKPVKSDSLAFGAKLAMAEAVGGLRIGRDPIPPYRRG